MLKILSKKIAIAFSNGGYIEKENLSAFTYSMEVFLATMMNFIILLVMGIAFRLLPEVMFFSLGFIPFRMMNGGYHASTHLKCTIILIIAVLFMCIGVKLNLQNFLFLPLLLISIPLFFIHTLKDNGNILSDEKKKRLVKRSRIIASVGLSVAILVFLFTPLSVLSYAYLFGTATSALSVIVCKITVRKNHVN